MKNSEVVEKIIGFSPAEVDAEHTRDTYKYGDPDQECTGVVVTVCATMDVIREAIAKGANLIISHEGIFWGDEFDTEKEFGGDPILAQKRSLLEEGHMTVWRYHDHMHGGFSKPGEPRQFTDYIYYGIMKQLQWDKYCVGDEKKPVLFEIPETTIEGLCDELVQKANLNGLRIVGSTTGKVSKVFFCEHAQGRFDAKIIRQAKESDVLIPLEIVDWTASSYIRDAVQCGEVKAVLELGHFNFEELGMQYMAEGWLPEVLGDSVPVYFVQSGDSFHYYVK